MANLDEDYFWSGAEREQLLFARCAKCSLLQHPPTPMCPRCGSLDWDIEQSSGHGRIYSWIVSHHPTKPDEAPRIVVLVEMDEGWRLVSNLRGIVPAEVSNDMPVEVTFVEIDGVTTPQFRPSGQP